MNSGFKIECNSIANIRDIMVVKALTPLIMGVMALLDYLVAVWLPG